MLNTIESFDQKKIDFNSFDIKLVLPSLILFAFYFSEFISKYLKFSNFDFTRVSGVVKLLVEIFLCGYIFIYKKEFSKQLLKGIVLFTMFYILGQFFLLKESFLNRLVLNLYTLNSYVFVFILYYAFKPINKTDRIIAKKQLSYLDTTIKGIFIINAFAILIGFIFNLDLFKTYIGFSNRFGYNGLFLHASHSSYIYIILIMYFFASYLNKKTNINFIFLLCSIVFSFMIGTKTIYLFNLLFLLYLLYTSVKRIYALFILFAIGIFIMFTYSFGIQIFKDNFYVLHKVYQNHGILTMLFSYRDINVTDGFVPYIHKNWSVINYIFGGAEFNNFRTEIEIVDLYWFLGFLGTFIYLKIFYNKILSELLRIKKLRFPMIAFLLCGLLSGSFFTNVPILPYLIIFYYAVTISFYQNSIQKQL
ncbi:hypothetical protein [uncultured Winogradskyella sp.]|uniref:hypothetical protein n=1 Tax=uncultured Winogradskyella sp. TaxID=395353 RepID=UPI00262B74F1|nr:hypothetical protein [uncultured Winogradskyella sp.]